jgi:membrane-associated protease RseP (regulator of RpoE activity)
MATTLPVSILGFVAALMLATVWHELGHLWVAHLRGVPVRLIAIGMGPALWRRALAADVRLEVRALPLGMSIGVLGRRAADGQLRRPVQDDLAIAAAGPLASLLLAPLLIGLTIPIIHGLPGLAYWLIATAILSVLLAVMNLIPIPGLDGGHLLVLTLAHLGRQLSPQREVWLHRTGMQVTIALTCSVSVLSLLARR